MLIGLQEIEGPDRIVAVATEILPGSEARFTPVFSHLDYLFYGRAPAAPSVWFFGGVTDLGLSVTGSGAEKQAGLMGVAGEVAEAHLAGSAHSDDASQPPDAGHRGIGAGASPQAAARHAALEMAERIWVKRWWQGQAPAILLRDQATGCAAPDPAIRSQGQRQTLLFYIADLDQAQVVVAASFDQTGQGFCFGAACRNTLAEAARSAINELVQAEIGLSLSRAKAEGAKRQTLARADRLALELAEMVSKDALLSSDLVLAPEAGVTPRGVAHIFPPTQITPLGVFEDVLHVAKAELAPKPALSRPEGRGAQAPFGHLALY